MPYEASTDRLLSSEKNHTPGHENCPACQDADKLLNLDNARLATLPFCDAAPIWLQIRKRTNLKPRTHERSGDYVWALEKFFGSIVLKKITAGMVREYQIARATNLVVVEDESAPGGQRETHPWDQRAGNSVINHEVCTLGRMLHHAGLWKKIKINYTPLPIPKWSPRDVLSEEDEEHFFAEAALHEDAQLAYWIATITSNTSASGSELRGLRLKHIFLRVPKLDEHGMDIDPSEIYIPPDAVKNESRPRKIALNPTARWAVQQCVNRALQLGSTGPDDYVFPFRVKKGTYDPKRPASRWFLRNSWNKLREHTQIEHIRPHDLRHQFITKMLENGENPETVRAIAGHVNDEMVQYYSHIRRQAKYAAVLAIEPSRKKGPMGVVVRNGKYVGYRA